MECEICNFKNPKATATAIIIKNNKILLLKRNQEPLKNMWDLPGGYMQEKETPEESLKREVKEELGTDVVNLTFIKSLPGTSYWKSEQFPVLSHFFLTDVNDSLTLSEENHKYRFFDLKNINPEEVAFDSNQNMIEWLKTNFVFDIKRVKDLTKQLDDSAVVNEPSIYKAILNGYVSKIYDQDKLVGFGWIFPRQTMLRKQAVVEDMIVDEVYRGKGYGKKILLDLIDWAKKEKIDVIELTSNPARIAANELYKKTGFKLHPTNHYLYKLVD